MALYSDIALARPAARSGAAAASLYYFRRFPEDPPQPETNPHFVGGYRAARLRALLAWRQNAAEDFSSVPPPPPPPPHSASTGANLRQYMPLPREPFVDRGGWITPSWFRLLTNLANRALTQAASVQTLPYNPGGTASPIGVMMGLAVPITPQQTGQISVTIAGSVSSPVATAGTLQIRYGSGGAPGYGAPLAGTQIGPIQAWTTAGADAMVPFALAGVVTGLPIGNPIWLDLAFAVTGGSIGTLHGVTVTAFEL